MKILEEAASPLFVDRGGSRKLLIGVILSLLPVVFFYPLGYVLAVLQARLEGGPAEALPRWKNMEALFIRGVVFFLVILTYSSLPFLFTSASFAMLKMGFVFLPPALVTLFISAVLWLLAVFIMPMAMVLFLKKKSAAAVFDLGEIYQRSSMALSRHVQATLLNLALLAVASLPAVMSPSGYLLSSPLIFVLMVYMANVYGAICHEVFPRSQG